MPRLARPAAAARAGAFDGWLNQVVVNAPGASGAAAPDASARSSCPTTWRGRPAADRSARGRRPIGEVVDADAITRAFDRLARSNARCSCSTTSNGCPRAIARSLGIPTGPRSPDCTPPVAPSKPALEVEHDAYRLTDAQLESALRAHLPATPVDLREQSWPAPRRRPATGHPALARAGGRSGSRAHRPAPAPGRLARPAAPGPRGGGIIASSSSGHPPGPAPTADVRGDGRSTGLRDGPRLRHGHPCRCPTAKDASASPRQISMTWP